MVIAHRSALALAVLTLIGLGLRLAVMSQSLLGDELFTYEIATRGDLVQVLEGVRSDLEITPPVYFVLAWLTGKLGDPLQWLRVPALLAGTATIPLVYAFGTRTVGQPAALLGAALTAFSPFMIFYSTEARAYSLATALGLLAALCLLAALESPRRWWWLAYVVASVAALYTHYTTVFVLFVLVAWGLWFHRERARPVLLANVLVALAFVPWLPSFLDDRQAEVSQLIIGVIEPFGLDAVQRGLLRWSVGSPFVLAGDLPGTLALAVLAVAAVLTLLGLADLVRRGNLAVRRPRPGEALVIALAAAGPVLAALYSVVSYDFFIARNFAVSWPWLALAVGALVTAIRPRFGIPALVLLAVGVGIGAYKTLGEEFRRPPYSQVAGFLDREATSGDAVLEQVLLSPIGPPARALEVNFQRPHRLVRLGDKDAVQRAQDASRGSRLFVVVPGAECGDQSVDGLDPLLRLETCRRFAGLADLTVFVYENAAPASTRGKAKAR